MRIGSIASAGCCAVLVAFFAFAPSAVSEDYKQERAKYEEHLEHIDHEHRFVKITEGNLRPDVLRISQDESIGWLYYGGHAAWVSFDQTVAKNVTCSSPGAFQLQGDRIRSRALERYEFVSFCKLKPGEYTYRVDLADRAQATASQRQLAGKVIVQ